MTDLSRYEKHCDIYLIDEETGEKWGMISKFLICESLYFEALLSKNWNAQNQNSFKIKTNRMWPIIREWIFTGLIDILPSDVIEIYKFVDMYQFERLAKAIESFINFTLDSLTKQDPLTKVETMLFTFSDIDYLMQPKFYPFFIKFRKFLTLKHFSFDPWFSLLSCIALRETERAKTPLKYSHFAIQSANFSVDLSSSTDMSKIDQIEISLLPSLKMKYDFLNIKNAYEFQIVENLQIFGVNEDETLTELDSKSSEFYSKFIIQFNTIKNITNTVLSVFEFKGDLCIDYNYLSSQ